MIASLAILNGFKKEIREKIIGFGGHIQVSPYSDNMSYENTSFKRDEKMVQLIKNVPGVRHIQEYATKAAIMKKGAEIEGVVIKGIGTDFDWDFFKNKIIEGNAFDLKEGQRSDKILLSEQLSKKLKLKVGDKIIMHFIQRPPRSRKFEVAGIYKTGLEEFDKLIVLADIKHIRKINDWDSTSIGGLEIMVNDFDNLDVIKENVLSVIPYEYTAESIKDVQPQLFDWLKLQDINVQIIIVLMLLVAGINMITALLVIILENTSTIGILKTLGCSNASIQKIFIYHGVSLISWGLLWGNAIGIGLCLLQKYTHLIKLDQASYYVAYVPVFLSPVEIIVLNIGSLLVCTAMLIIPSFIINRISIIKTVRFN